MDLRRLCCAGLCACGAALVALEVPSLSFILASQAGAALVVLEVPSLRFMLASQAGLAAGWRIAAMPPNILASAWAGQRGWAGLASSAGLQVLRQAAGSRLVGCSSGAGGKGAAGGRGGVPPFFGHHYF